MQNNVRTNQIDYNGNKYNKKVKYLNQGIKNNSKGCAKQRNINKKEIIYFKKK